MTNNSEEFEVEDYSAAFYRARPELTGKIAAERRRVAKMRWFSVIATLCLAFGFLMPTTHPVIIVALLILSLILIIAAAAVFTASFLINDIDYLEHCVECLDHEEEQVKAVRKMIKENRPFALFLRSFKPELGGLSDASVKKASITRARRAIFQSRYGDFDIEYDASHLNAGAKWKSQLAIMKSIHQRLPVVLLGNIEVEREMSRELRALGIQEVVIQVLPWWSVLTSLAKNATVIFFFIEATSSSLVKEMEHVVEQRYCYVIFADARQINDLPTAFPNGQSFIDGAKEVIAFDEASISNPNPIDAKTLVDLFMGLGL